MSTLKPTTVKPESRSIKFGRGLRDLLSSKRHSRTSSSPNAQSLDNFETNSTQEWAHKPSINIEESVEPLVPTIDIGALLYSHASSHLTSVQSRQSLRSHNSKGSLASNHVDPHSERQWKKAYEIAMEKLDEKEKLQVDQDKISSYTVYSVLEIADRALADQEEKKWRYTKKNGEVVVLKERFDNIIKGFTKYADCIGITSQHQLEVTSLV
ncbi:hypothetical protein CPB86DRAFT_145107 [Serendipita vermifera]|nr:hypothetical protein CPB86DRAFT_145107 [Serendipita vermifera]